MRPPEVIEDDVVNTERNGSERHRIGTHHPVFMREEIFIVNGGFKSFERGIKPEDGHEHETNSFPRSTFSEERHVKPGRRADEQHHKNINFAGDDVDLLPFFQYPGRKLYQRGKYAERSSGDMYVKTKSPNGFAIEHFPRFKKWHAGIEREEIRDGIKNQQQAQQGDGNPEQHKHPEGDGAFRGEYPAVHWSGFADL